MEGLFRLEIVSQDDGMFVVKTGCVDGNGLKQVAIVSANKLEDIATDDPDKIKAENASLRARVAELEQSLAEKEGALEAARAIAQKEHDEAFAAILKRNELEGALCQGRAEQIDVVFDGPPSHESGRFVEVENSEGKSISFGEWVHREDGYWALRFQVALSSVAPCPHEAEAKRLREAVEWMINEGASWMPDSHSAQQLREELRRRAGE